ncbi:Putative retroelement [Phytophthora palmivora]|uniref:Retroelement n=1 Tax=Phytophthora palmivora TaxID=4796 RepID=A0A2P4Y6Q1_9STRA|nr:Putative retroelement [Phytophthora palmivora]
MPRKEDTFDAMAGSYWFSCMDLLWVFSTPDGLFEYLVTPMGLSGSPETFNRLLQKAFRDLRDIMVKISEHLDALDRVLKRCEEQKLYIELSKCQLCVDEIPCLCDFVGSVRKDPDKLKIIAEWPFIKGKRSREAIQLDENQLRCYEELKRHLSSPPVLQLPDFSKQFGIRMDASNFAIGGVLFQEEVELEHPIAYTGRKKKPAELNYPVREQELLAIMHALKTWRVYLLDKPFTVETDHKSIEMILTQKTTNRRIARWFNELAEFQPLFKWIPGETNTVADARL